MSVSITLTADTMEELKTELEAALAGLGGEAAEEEEEVKPNKRRGKKKPADDDDTSTDDDDTSTDDEDLTGDDTGDDEAEAKREKLTKAVRIMTKKTGGPDKIRAAFRKVKAKVLSDVEDDDLDRVAKLLGVKL